MSRQPKQKLIEEVFGKDANLYTDALRVKPKASGPQIEKAYFREWQNARNKLTPNLPIQERNEINKKLEALLIAYRILSNPTLRSKYNEMMTDTDAELKQVPLSESPSLSGEEPKHTNLESSDLSYSARSTKEMLKTSSRKVTKNELARSHDEYQNTSFGSADGTIVQAYEGNLFGQSDSFVFPGPDEGNETDDEDVFAGVDDDVTFDEPPPSRSFESESTANPSFDSFRQRNNKYENTILEHSDDYEENNENNNSMNDGIRSVGSSLKQGKYSKKNRDEKQTPSSPTPRGVRFQGVDDDDDTLGDTTIGDTTIGDDDLDSLRDENMNSSCLNMLCVPSDKQYEMNRMLYNLSAEIRDSFDDTINAVDQVFNAFTIQPDEYSDLITKLETEKQTLLFSSEFMELAKQERQKRLEAEKKSQKEKSQRIR